VGNDDEGFIKGGCRSCFCEGIASPNKRRVKLTNGQNLFVRLNKYGQSILIFARIKEVGFTNNRAERDIRCSKTKQKVSGCFRTVQMTLVGRE